MSFISYSVSTDTPDVLRPYNVEPLFDEALLHQQWSDVPNSDRSRLLHGLPMYKVMVSFVDETGRFNSDCMSTHISLGDYEAKKHGRDIAVLVSKSKILNQAADIEEAYVIQNIPLHQETPLPNRILVAWGSDTVHTSIQGFYLQKHAGKRRNVNVGLLVGEDPNNVEMRTLGKFQNKDFVAGQLASLVLKAQHASKIVG